MRGSLHSSRAPGAGEGSCGRSLVRWTASTRARRCSRVRASSSLLSGISSIFGGSRDVAKGKEAERPAVDTTLNGEKANGPVFPPYTVVHKTKDYTLRLYDVFPVVEMDYQRREEGYALLGAYIDGANAAASRFPHSQPVVMCYHPDGRKVMQMYVRPPAATPLPATATASAAEAGTPPPQTAAPASPSAASTRPIHASSSSRWPACLPAPTAPGVRLAVGGGELAAVAAFQGFITPASAAAVRQRLVAALERDGILLSEGDAAGGFRCAQYGAVYRVGARLNELALRVHS